MAWRQGFATKTGYWCYGPTSSVVTGDSTVRGRVVRGCDRSVSERRGGWVSSRRPDGGKVTGSFETFEPQNGGGQRRHYLSRPGLLREGKACPKAPTRSGTAGARAPSADPV